VSTAVKLTTTGAVSAEEYAAFCETYGADVTEWEGYELLAGARELRMTTYAAQHATSRAIPHRLLARSGRDTAVAMEGNHVARGQADNQIRRQGRYRCSACGDIRWAG
jgi:hypothetical protein